MSPTTEKIITLLLDSDPSVTREERKAIMDVIDGVYVSEITIASKTQINPFVSRSDLAALVRKSVKWVDLFHRTHPGILEKVVLPGETRALGFTHESVQKFLEGGWRTTNANAGAEQGEETGSEGKEEGKETNNHA